MPPPSEKKKKRASTLELQISKAEFPVLLTFNRFGIEPIETGDLLLHFGLINTAGQLSAFAFVLELTHCLQSKESWSEYLGRLGAPSQEGDDTFRVNPSLLRRSFLPTVNFLSWHRTGDMGELKAYCFALPDLHEAASTGQKLATQSVALLRSSSELQIQLLVKIVRRIKQSEDSPS